MNQQNTAAANISTQKNTWSPLMEFPNDLNHLFESVWGEANHKLRTSYAWAPPSEVSENEHHFLLSFEIPGIPKDQVEIEVIEDALVISGERKPETKNRETKILYTERRFGKFQRTFALPKGLETSKIEANFQDGVLRVLIPKAEAAKPRKIKIDVGSDGTFLEKMAS
jgi:HSP20 family protein